jgi:hypothetical protein
VPRPGRFNPGKDPLPIVQEVGGPQSRSGRVRKFSPPPRFDPRTFQPVVSRYADGYIYIYIPNSASGCSIFVYLNMFIFHFLIHRRTAMVSIRNVLTEEFMKINIVRDMTPCQLAFLLRTTLNLLLNVDSAQCFKMLNSSLLGYVDTDTAFGMRKRAY